MKKEKVTKLRLVEPDAVRISPSDVEIPVPVEDSTYQSNPVKNDLYSKLAAYRQSLKKFNIQDLIRDSLK